MEALGAGASVLAFVGLALQSTKVLSQTVSGFKNASRQITALASAVRNLQNILTQLEGCRALSEPRTDVQHLADLVNACIEDVGRYDKELKKIQPCPDGPKIQQAWKKMKTMLADKDLVWKEVSQHCTALSAQLNILQW